MVQITDSCTMNIDSHSSRSKSQPLDDNDQQQKNDKFSKGTQKKDSKKSFNPKSKKPSPETRINKLAEEIEADIEKGKRTL